MHLLTHKVPPRRSEHEEIKGEGSEQASTATNEICIRVPLTIWFEAVMTENL